MYRMHIPHHVFSLSLGHASRVPCPTRSFYRRGKEWVLRVALSPGWLPAASRSFLFLAAASRASLARLAVVCDGLEVRGACAALRLLTDPAAAVRVEKHSEKGFHLIRQPITRSDLNDLACIPPRAENKFDRLFFSLCRLSPGRLVVFAWRFECLSSSSNVSNFSENNLMAFQK